MGALLALIPLIGQVLPSLVPALATPLLGNVLSKAGTIAQDIFGTTDPTQIALQVQQDASKADKFKARLAAETADEQAMLVDVQSARQQTTALAAAGSSLAYGAPLISILVTVGFFGVMVLFLYSPVGDNPVVTMLVGTMATSFGAVVQYWIGSSVGSRDKDNLMASMTATNVGNAASTAKDLASKVISVAAAVTNGSAKGI